MSYEPPTLSAEEICHRLTEWAKVANVSNPRAGSEYLAVMKSDLLSRLIYGRERAPSETPCPVHRGTWSGCGFGWPYQEWVPNENIPNPPPIELSEHLVKAWLDGCRCSLHVGSSCTTGWQPDEACGCIGSETYIKNVERATARLKAEGLGIEEVPG